MYNGGKKSLRRAEDLGQALKAGGRNADDIVQTLRRFGINGALWRLMILYLPPTVYLVEPTNALLEVVAHSQFLRSFLAEPKVWQNQEGGSELTASAREAVAKRVILAYFLSFEEVDILLRKPDVSEDTFDRYWHLRRLPIEGSLHHLAVYAKRIDKERIIPTGSDFLDRVVANMLNSAGE